MRRCTDEKCRISADKKSTLHLNLPIATILKSQQDWVRMAYGNKRVSRDLDVDWKKFGIDDYLLTHSSIVCSVNTADNGYYIEPPCDELVNANGNAWTTPVLLSSFKSFIGADNFVEHVQVKELSKGRILDAILRPVDYVGKNGKKSNVLWCDILVATDRKHTDLINQIESGELNTLSMGCVANVVTCSRCGKEIDDSMKNCSHLDNDLLNYFVDENGVKRIVSELCGRSYVDQSTGKRVGDPDSVKFIEASWVGKPAFKGAVVNHFISEIPKKIAKRYSDLSTHQLETVMNDIFRMRVADTEGMMVLRVAREELLRRNREAMVDRVAKSITIFA